MAKKAKLMSMSPHPKPVYDDGRVKQSFKDETDINKILQRAQKTGTISHLNQYSGVYGDFSDFDFFESQVMLTKGREIFDALPSEIRKEFGQSQAEFFAYVNDSRNKDRLAELLPALAAPGKQNINVSGITPADETPAPEEPPAAAPAAPTPVVAEGTPGPTAAPEPPSSAPT